MNNFIAIVLDGVGVGELPDASNYGDQGSNTLGNLSEKVGGLNLPNLQKFGLGNIIDIKGVASQTPLASYGKMMEISKGKDSTTGHWELGGLKVEVDFPYYPEGFPKSILDKFISLNNLPGILGNKAASGTVIIEELGDEHVKTGKPIVYTSADSVFQIAAHEDVIPIDQLYKICEISRNEIFINENSVGRIIARPFVGKSGEYKRTTNRKDFSIAPPQKTILDYLTEDNIQTIAIGKINDLFNYQGIKTQVKTKSNSEGIEAIIDYSSKSNNSFIFVNLVDFDVYYGHRNDPEGFHNALIEFDEQLPKILDTLDETDVLAITADHGNDPTTISTDHSREYVPILFYQKNKAWKNLGTRETFSDLAQTIAHFYKVNNDLKGTSFLNG